MSITPALKASARSAYRSLYRAASSTFAGDAPLLAVFRQRMRNDVRNAQSVTSPEDYSQRIQLFQEMATFLRRNVVQAVKVDADKQGGEETWRIRMTKDTELGDNESIKNPPPMESSRGAKKRQQSSSDVVRHESTVNSSSSQRPLHYSALKKAHRERKLPELREGDLEESFVRGSGPGGQSINKTENNVQLLHKPTGLRVSCQETRSLAQNRKIARKLLMEKLDQIENPGLSKEKMKRARQIERERRKRKKQKKKSTAKQKQLDSMESEEEVELEEGQ